MVTQWGTESACCGFCGFCGFWPGTFAVLLRSVRWLELLAFSLPPFAQQLLLEVGHRLQQVFALHVRRRDDDAAVQELVDAVQEVLPVVCEVRHLVEVLQPNRTGPDSNETILTVTCSGWHHQFLVSPAPPPPLLLQLRYVADWIERCWSRGFDRWPTDGRDGLTFLCFPLLCIHEAKMLWTACLLSLACWLTLIHSSMLHWACMSKLAKMLMLAQLLPLACMLSSPCW